MKQQIIINNCQKECDPNILSYQLIAPLSLHPRHTQCLWPHHSRIIRLGEETEGGLKERHKRILGEIRKQPTTRRRGGEKVKGMGTYQAVG